MKHFVEISDKKFEIDIESSNPMNVIHVDGKPVNVTYNGGLRHGRGSLLIADKPIDIRIFPNGDETNVQIGSTEYRVRVEDERTRKLNEIIGTKHLESDSARDVKAPMPGLVVLVDVKEGDTVAKGQQILVIEAMKMENPITSPADGTIENLKVEAGQAVDKGELLMTVKKGEKSA